MRAHSKFPPSAALRSLNCPPSLLLGEQFADEESVYAAEGTAGHALAEHLIKKYLKQRTRRPTSDFYTDELIEAVDEYVTFVRSKLKKPDGSARLRSFLLSSGWTCQSMLLAVSAPPT